MDHRRELSNDDGDVNEEVKEAVALDWGNNNNFACAAHFLVFFHYRQHVTTQDNDFLFLLLNFDTVF